MDNIDVSILILTHNRCATSIRGISSVLKNVGNGSFEVLIWDNGSTDGTYKWLEKCKHKYPMITKVYKSKKNIGMEAINNLAQDARGKYLLKVDDDIVVPKKFTRRLLAAYREIKDERLAFLGWDMPWWGGTFATRSGTWLYKEPNGKRVATTAGPVYIHYNPARWMCNGACRFGPKDTFLKIGGHPKGMIYGCDTVVNARAAKAGYWIGYLCPPDLIAHIGW